MPRASIGLAANVGAALPPLQYRGEYLRRKRRWASNQFGWEMSRFVLMWALTAVATMGALVYIQMYREDGALFSRVMIACWVTLMVTTAAAPFFMTAN